MRDRIRPRQAVLGPPPRVHRRDGAQPGNVARIIRARRSDRRLDIARGQIETVADEGLYQSGQPRHCVGAGGTGAQKGLRPPLAHAQAERPYRIEHVGTVQRFLRNQQFRQRLARQHLFLTPLKRAEAGKQAGLERKRGEQALAKAVDRLNADAAAGRVEHPRKERARARHHSGIEMILAKRKQLLAQIGLGHPHPAREPAIDPSGHLARTRLRKGEAQDRSGVDSAQQQAIDARGQHLCLAGPRRRRQPDMAFRVARARLIALQPGQEAAGLTHGPTIRRGASAGHSRHRARRAGLAWR